MTDDVRIDDHAHERWLERLGGRMWARHPLMKAWREGVPVEAPEVDADETRVYELPIGYDDMLLVAHKNGDGLLIKTVLYADHQRLVPIEEE